MKERSRSASSLEAADLDFSVIEVILRDLVARKISLIDWIVSCT